MILDAAANFAKSTLTTGYDAAATSIVLSSGGGALFPAPPFNATWWNSDDYADPANDPSVEIVRVDAIATDTFTIQRAQESTAASTKNSSGKTYTLIAAPTAKLLTDLLTPPAYVRDEPLIVPDDDVLTILSGSVTWADAEISPEFPCADYEPETDTVFFPGSTVILHDDPFVVDSPYLADLGGNASTLLWTDAARCPQVVSTLLVIGV